MCVCFWGFFLACFLLVFGFCFCFYLSSFCVLYQMLHMSLDCPFLIAHSVFSNVYFIFKRVCKQKHKEDRDTNKSQRQNNDNNLKQNNGLYKRQRKPNGRLRMNNQRHKQHLVQNTERRQMVARR